MVTKIVPTGSRIATATGAVLLDPEVVDRKLANGNIEHCFDPEYWRARGALVAAPRGRGSAWFLATPVGDLVLRHYRRGGAVAPVLSADRYLWMGEDRVRAFVEWRLMARLWALGLPVPQPIAARYSRRGLTYCCDLLMRRIPDARPLSAALAEGALPSVSWIAIGALVARFHTAGVDHADLNAHNILLGKDTAAYLIDFDRGRIRTDGRWKPRNLERLRRSLDKISRELPADRFSAAAWQSLLGGYTSALRV